MLRVLAIIIICLSGFLTPTFSAQEKPKSNVEQVEELPEEIKTYQQILLDKFKEGDWRYMTPILLCFVFGMAIVIERIISLHLASVNPHKLVKVVNEHLKKGDVEGAQEYCRTTPGPVASILTQGLYRLKEGVASAEKSIFTTTSVEMDKLGKGLVWVNLFIMLAPMLGFMGTVIGMIKAFDDIVRENDISAGIVAGGIKVALLTTVAGLIIAIILQLFYNYCISKIDSLTSEMEEAGADFVDMIYDKDKHV